MGIKLLKYVILMLMGVSILFASCKSTQKAAQTQHDQQHKVEKDAKGIRHVVAKGERIEQIARENHITVSEIVSLNKLTSLELVTGQVLILPIKVEEQNQTLSNSNSPNQIPTIGPPRKKLTLACVFPFGTMKELEPNVSDEEIISQSSIPALEMMAGVYLATDSLRQSSIDVTLIIRDAPESKMDESELINELSELSPDFIFAHLNEDRIQSFSEKVVSHQLKLIVFMSADHSFLHTGSNLFLYTPSVKTQIEEMAAYIGKQYSSDNVLVLYGEEEKEKDLALLFRKELNRVLMRANADTVRVSGPYTNSFTRLPEIMNKTKNNLMLVCSSREAFVTRLSNYLNELEDYKIQVCGLPTWAYFEGIDNRKKDKLNFTYFTPSYINYDESRITDLRQRMIESYRCDLSYHSLGLFDLTYHFCKTWLQNPQDYMRLMQATPGADMDFVFDFRPEGEEQSAWENHKIYILQHQNTNIYLLK